MGVYGDLVPEVRRIAVLRANAIGDFIFTLPALEAIRAAYPDAELVLLGRPWHATFLADRPGRWTASLPFHLAGELASQRISSTTAMRSNASSRR